MVRFDYNEYIRKFKKKSTASLIAGYHKCNEDFRRITRAELKRRHVPARQLPYKKRRRTTERFTFF